MRMVTVTLMKVGIRNLAPPKQGSRGQRTFACYDGESW